MIQTTTHPKHHFSTWYLATCLKFCMRTLNYVFIHHLSGMHLGSCKYFCILRFMMCQPHLTIFITFSTIQTLLLLWKTLSKGFKEVFSNGIVKCDRQRPPTEIGTFSYTVFKPRLRFLTTNKFSKAPYEDLFPIWNFAGPFLLLAPCASHNCY